nr:alkaline phosphatase family protein [Pandoraea eparura]
MRNVLFIMADQLRRDYLSCYGHPTLHTPHLDALAKRGVRFDRAYVQGPVCGPSRMSYYTGRYVTSHGAIWNFVPVSVREQGLGDYLRPHGIRTAVAGKTHMEPDVAGMARLGIERTSEQGVLAEQLGFEPFDRDDGVWPPGFVSEHNQYTAFLKKHGYVSDNPWHDFANSAASPNGEVLSGWEMRYANLPARVKAEHSETPYMTDRAIDFIREQGESPWCLHLSYIKPHWPYVAPAPYHDMYKAEDVLPVKQHSAERGDDAHPVMQGFQRFAGAENFSQEAVRKHVIPVYMGLVKQLDDEIGRLMAHLEQAGRLEDTMIVFCSDHGDYLGDHYLAEKELFHDTVARVPLIVYDPSREADITRGRVESRLVESIDVVPTILTALGVMPQEHILEGRSLQPLLHGEAIADWRDAVFSEMNYAFRDFVRLPIQQPIERCHGYMVSDERWKCVFFDDLRPQLFDLENDPDEFHDLGADPTYAVVRERARERLFEWLRHRKIHPTVSYPRMAAWTRKEQEAGIHICAW